MRPPHLLKSTLPVLFVALILLAGCRNKSPAPNYTPGDVAVGFHDSTQIQTAFAAMNGFGLKVEAALYFQYLIPYPADSIEPVKAYLNQKKYINQANGAWSADVFYNEKARALQFNSRLTGMDSGNQADFLQVIRDKPMVDMNTKIKTFYLNVPVGREQYWAEELKKLPFVKWTELNNYAELEF